MREHWSGCLAGYTQDGKHLKRPGSPKTTKRLDDFLPMELALQSEAYRGASMRFGRNPSAYNGLADYAVKKRLLV